MMFPIEETEMLHQIVQRVDDVQTDMQFERSGSPKDIIDLDKMRHMSEMYDNTWDYSFFGDPNASPSLPDIDTDGNWDIDDMNLDSLCSSMCCPKCSMSFNSVDEFESHVECHETESYDQNSSNSNNLTDMPVDPNILENGSETEDEEDVARYKSRKCKICQRNFRSDETLKRHLNTHSVKNHECDVCNGKFSSAHSLNRHKARIHVNKKTYECRLCGLSFLNTQTLYRHRDSHIQQSLEKDKYGKTTGFTCGICSKVYSRKSKLFEHMDSHSKTTVKCFFCNEQLTYLALQVHIKKNHVHEVCQICDNVFIDKKLFLEHEKDHFNVNDNTCDYCLNTFEEQEILCIHMMMEHINNSEEYKCDYCLKTYHTERHLKHHRSFSHLAICQFCNKRFNRHSDLSSHVKQAHRSTLTEQPTKCQLCKAKFSSRSRLATHLAHTHGLAKPYRCKLCKGGFRNLKEHRKNCSALPSSRSLDEESYLDTAEINFESDEKNSFSCPFCDRVYENQPNLKKHLLRKHKDATYDANVKYYECEVCKKSFLTSHELNVHSGMHSEEKSYVCKICNKSYKYQTNLSQHYKEAHSQKSYPCEQCNEVFDLKVDLKKHKYSKHPDVFKSPLYQCSECSKILSSQFALKTHMTVHSDDRPFKCMICEQSCKTELILKRHLQAVHVGEKTFVCNYCSAKFKTKIVLNKHMYRKHRDEIPQSLIDKFNSQKVNCKLCDKEFPNKCRLKIHMRTHTKDKPVECNICAQTLSSKYSLIRHIKYTHSPDEVYDNLVEAEAASLDEANSVDSMPETTATMETASDEITSQDSSSAGSMLSFDPVA